MILLDTQVLLWSRFDDRRLGVRSRQQIGHALREGDLAAAAISFWEVAMLQARGRLALLTDIGSWRMSLLQDGLIEIPVDGDIGVRAGLLPDLHGDPADRLIVATALAGVHRLVTADRRILDWPGRLAKMDARE